MKSASSAKCQWNTFVAGFARSASFALAACESGDFSRNHPQRIRGATRFMLTQPLAGSCKRWDWRSDRPGVFFSSWSASLRGAISGYLFHASNRKPIVAPPAERAANRPEGKHGAKFVQRMHLARFEMDRVAAWAIAPEPQHARQPIRPDYCGGIHSGPSFCETTPFALRGKMECGVNSGRLWESQPRRIFVHWKRRD